MYNEANRHRIVGCYIAWRLRHQSKTEWLSSNKTQKGQDAICVPLGYTLRRSSFLPKHHLFVVGASANDGQAYRWPSISSHRVSA
jgi:hypothetical protein